MSGLREKNEEADQLSNFKFESFDAKKRIIVKPSEIPWILLQDFMENSRLMFLDLQKEGNKAKRRQEDLWPGARVHKRLKSTDPWR